MKTLYCYTNNQLSHYQTVRMADLVLIQLENHKKHANFHSVSVNTRIASRMHKDQSNLAKGGITPSFYPPAGSIGRQLHVLVGRSTPQISPSPRGDQGPTSNTMCHWTTQAYLPNVTQIRQTV